MKKRLLLILLLGIFAFISCEEETTIHILSEEKLPHDYMFMQRAYPSGQIKGDASRLAADWKRSKQSRTNQASQQEPWEFVGPLNIGGRITDIETVSEDESTIYVGAASGGIFKSVDSGSTWEAIFDDQSMLAIGDIAVDLGNTNFLAVGTGEVNAGGGSLAYDGDGIYVSADAGATWENKGLQEVGSIGKVIIHPNDPDIIYVGAMGPLFKNDTNRGVYKTTDGGDSWSQVLFVADNAGVVDMSIHPTNPDIIYAASWQRERTPENRIYGGENSNIYKSTDGGITWAILDSGLPSNGNEKGRISIDISLSNPDVLYASYADATGNIQGIYKTEDGGDAWITKNSSQLTNVGFHWWFGGLFINPVDENEVYHVGFEMQKTVDGGDNWITSFPGVHVDQHALAFDPNDASHVLLGNDGGLYTSTNSGVSSVMDETLPITQFYRIFVDPSNGNKIYGGAQDNSTMRTTTGGDSDWQIINGGDGFQPLVDKDNTNVIYALSQRGFLRKSTNDGTQFTTVLNGVDPNDRNNWDTPIAFDPQDNDIVYYGTNRLYRSTDAAASWIAISPDLTNGPSTGNLNFGSLTSIDVSPLDSDVIYVGADDGNVWGTTDGGINWMQLSTTLPNRWVTRVRASLLNADEVYVTFSGYRFGENEGSVFVSQNNGQDWTELSTDLPDIPVNDIEIDDFGNLFIATDIGVLSSDNNGNSWEPFDDNMPPVVVTDIHIDQASQYMYAGTYGRSMYKVDISDNALSNEEVELMATSLKIFPNPAENEINVSVGDSTFVGSLSIYNMLGQLKIDSVLSAGESLVDITSLASGMYIVQAEVGGKTLSQKLIKN